MANASVDDKALIAEKVRLAHWARLVKRMTRLTCMAIVSWALVVPTSARGDNYPARPIRIISPYAPGGSNDIVARILA